MLRACYRVVAGGLWLVVGTMLFSCKPHGPKSPVQAVAPVESLHCVAANKGETFLNFLKRAGLDSSRSQSVRQNLAAFDIVNPVCAAGESLVGFYRDARLYRFEYRQRYDRTFVFRLDTLRTRLAMTYHWVRVEPKAYSGTIRSSLWMALQNAGIKPDMTIRFADLFSWDVDFFTETQAGDSFKLILEQLRCDDRSIGKPQLQAGEYKGKCGSTTVSSIRTRRGGRTTICATANACAKDSCARRCSSRAYPPISAPAGIIRFCGLFARTRESTIRRGPARRCGQSATGPWPRPAGAGGYGNLVEISHGSGYRSRYGHLSRFGKGIRSGVRVGQGQIIGYVGTTGMSTGPHLHFEVRVNGVARNPMRIIPPRAEALPRKYLAEFQQRADSLTALLNAPSPKAETTSAGGTDSVPAGVNQDSAW